MEDDDYIGLPQDDPHLSLASSDHVEDLPPTAAAVTEQTVSVFDLADASSLLASGVHHA